MLEISNISTSYSGIRAVRSVSLSIPEGKMVALIGRNGAGKTTLLNTISGVLTPESGQILFDGEDISGKKNYDIARRGLLQVPEGRQILGSMSVEENLDLGCTAAAGRENPDVSLDMIYELFPILAERRQQDGETLSGGEQQMLAIGRALMGNPRLLLLDEPSLGLAPKIVTEVFNVLAKLNERGLTILLVEQNARRALAATDYTYVLEQGEVVMHGESADLVSDPAIIAHYLGVESSKTDTR